MRLKKGRLLTIKIQTNPGMLFASFLIEKNLLLLIVLNHLFDCSKESYNLFIIIRSGFGFVTYKTVEAAKKALDDPHKTFGVSQKDFFYGSELKKIVWTSNVTLHTICIIIFHISCWEKGGQLVGLAYLRIEIVQDRLLNT